MSNFFSKLFIRAKTGFRSSGKPIPILANPDKCDTMRTVDISPVSMLVLPSKDSLKKWLSSFLVFIIFAGQTFQIPFSLQKALAAGSDAPNLVSIIVSESTNS